MKLKRSRLGSVPLLSFPYPDCSGRWCVSSRLLRELTQISLDLLRGHVRPRRTQHEVRYTELAVSRGRKAPQGGGRCIRKACMLPSDRTLRVKVGLSGSDRKIRNYVRRRTCADDPKHPKIELTAARINGVEQVTQRSRTRRR